MKIPKIQKHYAVSLLVSSFAQYRKAYDSRRWRSLKIKIRTLGAFARAHRFLQNQNSEKPKIRVACYLRCSTCIKFLYRTIFHNGFIDLVRSTCWRDNSENGLEVFGCSGFAGCFSCCLWISWHGYAHV